MNGMSEAYAANEAERQARHQAVQVEPGPEEQALNQVLAGGGVGWTPDAVSAQRVRAGHERSQREREARKGTGE